VTTDPLLELAKNCTLEAGKLLKTRNNNLLQVNSESSHDIKLRADEEAEILIRKIIASQSSYPILGEEMGGESSSLQSGAHWIIDPLDGTANYSRGNPCSCVSVALWEDLKPRIGVIYNFSTEEMLSGSTLTKCAYLNEKKIKTSGIKERSKAIYSTGFPISMNLNKDSQSRFFDKVKAFKKIRMIGSAALSLGYVASGIFDIYEEESIYFWDVAAGLALVKAAGGSIDFHFTEFEKFILNVRASATEDLARPE
jgi:myo-inositol-1(or 4)-monophosphatase